MHYLFALEFVRSFQPFEHNTCSRCRDRILVSYHRLLDPFFEGIEKDVTLPSGHDHVQVFGREALSSYSGRVNYLGQYTGEGGIYSIFCCGSCWLEYIESPSFQAELLARERAREKKRERARIALQEEEEARRKEEARMGDEDDNTSDNMEAEMQYIVQQCYNTKRL